MVRILVGCLTLALSLNLFSRFFDVDKLSVEDEVRLTSGIKNVALTFTGTFEITDQWERAYALSHLFENNYSKRDVLDPEGQFVSYEHDENLNASEIAQLLFTFWKVTIPAMDLGKEVSTPETSDKGIMVGLNLCVGVNYKLSARLNPVPELGFNSIHVLTS